MVSKTKKILIIAFVTAVIFVVALGFFFKEIRDQGLFLKEQVTISNENRTKEELYNNLKRLAQDTEVERSSLASYFFKTESDSITFLGDVESTASELGLSFKTEALDRIVEKESKKEFIKMVFVYEGKKETVFNFSKLMEVAPYHSVVDSLSLRKLSGDDWEGKLTILVTLNSI